MRDSDGVKVLLVDDEPRLVDAVQRGLAAEGFQVEVARDGEQGLWMAREGTYDVIVLDIMLPKLNGYRVCQSLRDEEIWTPVLMLTAKDGEHDEADAFDLGADDYLTKPFSFVVLVARLRALLRRGAPERPVVLQAGDLTLDQARRHVLRAEQEIPLTPREFGLLHFLLRRKGDVVTKSEILAAVWDENYEGDSNVVEVYIGYLRRKIDAPFDRQAIETVRGVGYRLADNGG